MQTVDGSGQIPTHAAGAPHSQRRHYDSGAEEFEERAFKAYEKRQWHVDIGDSEKNAGLCAIRLNPVSFLGSIAFTWGFVVYCLLNKESASAELADIKAWISDAFTWLFVGCSTLWVIFLIALYFSKYGSLKLGRPEDKPEFPAHSWFAMIFSAGIGTGILVFSVSEPISHYEPCSPIATGVFAGAGSDCLGNRYAQFYDNPRALWALTQTVFHWGLHGWTTYLIIALLLAMLVYRRGLPMTMKTAFYPLIGDKIYGWMGDVVDIASVVITVSGVSTSLGLVIGQISAGLSRLNNDIAVTESTKVAVVWAITLISLVSATSGLRVGIRRLSELNWLLGQFLFFAYLFQDDTWYLLNVFVQTCGTYLQWIISLGSNTEAFEQYYTVSTSNPTVASGKLTSEAPDGYGSLSVWMNDWTVFYWAWWVAWAPFVGMFIAKVSRGRTIRELVHVGVLAPVVYTFLYMSVFGGIALRIERMAANLGIECSPNDNGELEYFRTYAAPDANGSLADVTVTLEEPMVEVDGEQIWRLSCRASNDRWFDMIAAFPGRTFYWGLSIGCMVLYFVTSSDTSCLIVDCITSNGNPHAPVWQRMFWCATEGAMAMALILAGTPSPLAAIQSISILAALPFCFVLTAMCVALWRTCQVEWLREHGSLKDEEEQWYTELLDVFDWPTTSWMQAAKVLAATLAPWLYSGSAAASLGIYDVPDYVHQAQHAILFNLWPTFLILNMIQEGLWVVGWIMFLCYASMVTSNRYRMRCLRGIPGSVVIDYIVSICLYPLCVVQVFDENVALKAGVVDAAHSSHV